MRQTIVLIPGLMNDGWVWRGQIAALSRIAPIHIAHNDPHDSLAAMATAILHATHGPLAIVGHSMGGRVALEAVAQAPQRISRLVLLDTGAGPAAEGEAKARLALVDLAFAQGMAAVAERWLPPMLGPDASDAVVAGITAMLCRADPLLFERQQHALLARPDRQALLPAIACPTLIATGAHDAWAPPAQHERLAAAIPGARCVIVPGAGHMLPVEAPEALDTLLTAFLGGSGISPSA